MRWIRLGLVVGIVVVLGVVVFVWGDGWGSGEVAVVSSPSSVSTSSVVVSTSSSVVVSSTSVVGATGSSVASTTGPVDRVVEVEGILRGLWFGWFDAIYRKDPDALWKVDATVEGHEAGVAAMETMSFTEEPSLAGTQVRVEEVLLDRPDCLVAWFSLDVSAYRGPGAQTRKVAVLWPDARYGWRIGGTWSGPGDLWRTTCDLVTRESTP